MPLKESFKKRFENSLRVASVASLALAPHTPVFSSQEKVGSPKDSGHTLTVDTPLNLNGIPPLETPDGRRIVFGRETYEQQVTEDERVVAEIRRIFELRDLAAVGKNIPPGSIAWMTTASRYLFLSREQAMGVFRTAFERRQPQCLAFEVFDEGQNKKISVLMKDFGVLEWNGELSAASSISLTSYQGSWFISSVGEFRRSTLEEYTQRNSVNLRPCPPRALERQEQVQSQEVSVFGLSAEFTDKGNIIISSIDGRKQEINLPPLAEFYTFFGGMKFSPDGTKLVAWRDSHDKGKEGHTLFLISPQTGEFRPIFSDFVGSLNYLSRFIDLEWTQDGKKLRIASGHHGRGKGIVVDIDTEQVLFEYRGGTYGKFSPDGNWFARRYGDKDLEVRRISDGYRFTIRNNNGFTWSPDSSSLIFNRCLSWDDSGVWGPECMYTQLALYDLVKGELKNLIHSEPYVVPFFSASGEKVFFRRRANTRLTHFGVLNIRDGKDSVIDLTRFVDQGFNPTNWDWMFYGEETILGYGGKRNDPRHYFFWIDAASGSVKRQQWFSPGRDESVGFKGLFDNRMVFEVWNRNRNRWEYWIIPISEKNGQLEILQRVSSRRLEQPPSHGDELFAILPEGNQFKAGDKNFLFLGGKRYLIKHEETAGYFGGQKSSMPEGLAAFIPEGEPVEFRPGDVVGHKDLGIWYLRNGKRYEVQNWDWFTTRLRYRDWSAPRHEDAPRGRPTTTEVISRIPVGEVPEPSPGREGILDWDEKEKMYQPYGGRMIIFMGGYDGSTAGQLEAFRNIKAKLLERGWREDHFLEASYSIDQRLLRAGVVLPRPYESSHTALHPSFHVSHMSLQLQRYKEMFPLTKFILIGHSLGGYTLFNAALRHTDAIDTIVTIDSPIKGIDRSFYALDRIIAFFGEAVGSYLVELGDNPETSSKVENNAHQLRCRSVRIFTFTNFFDRFIPPAVATLNDPYLDEDCPGERAQMVWDLGIEWDDKTGHGKALYDPGVLETIATLLPPSGP